ncbi:hypothetical protein AABB24_020369 [Solanum stoloniferum]|uniref:RNase H type-1 domain-containing protein n=1 Tax=Solanum stoloniferum TaxID=62892 RepID=A0ABD2T7N6_9SOLN
MFEYEEYKELLTKSLSSCSSRNHPAIKLTNLEDGILLFTDAGLQNYDGRASIGIVALDSLGNLLHAHGSPIQFVGKVKTAEAIAIRKALKYAISKGWKRVKILSDAKNVVDMIQKRVTTSWEIEVLCEDIWKLSSMFNHVEFIYISRSVNKIADRLARYSISLLKEISWEKFFPSWIIQDAKDMFKLCIPLMQ